ncbi:hypothetical protein HYV11_00750 [Candidatus Dependentiae bacterium]|nr:hypothetical protein [Candidatus Dependentiae bacterium]
MEAIPANKDKSKNGSTYSLNLTVLEEKVVMLVTAVKNLKLENVELKEQNKSLLEQLKALEGSLVSETRDLEELSQEKIMTKLAVDDLLKSIDELIDQKEK